jgi:hypothetical protein
MSLSKSNKLDYYSRLLSKNIKIKNIQNYNFAFGSVWV